MVGIQFDRPVGPYADTKELEYISALHQTSPVIRHNGTIRAEDIRHYLSSRHGVRVTQDVVMNAILLELGGSLPIPEEPQREEALAEESEEDEDPPQPVLDICQITAMLFIPFFRKGNGYEDALLQNSQTKLGTFGLDDATKQQFDHHREVVGHVLEVALRNILAELKLYTTEADAENHGVVMTPAVLRQALEVFGEYNVPDEVLDEMILQAQTDRGSMNQVEVFFDKSAFLQALTADTQLYNPERIDTTESTHFDDARKARAFQQLALFGKTKELTGRRRSQVKAQVEDADGNVQKLPFDVIYMANNIDNTADTYRSATWFTLVWVETVLIYFAYMLGSNVRTSQIFDNCTNEFGCAIAKSLVAWIAIFFQLMMMGFTWVFMASLGNTTHPTESWRAKFFQSIRLLLAMGVVSFATIVSFFEESTTQFWDTTKGEFTQTAVWACFLGGIVILLFQITRLLGLFFPLGPLQAGGMEKKECGIKAAASYKIQNMVEHAMLLHGEPPSNLRSMQQSNVSDTILSVTSSLHSGVKKSVKARQRAMDAKGTTNKALLNFHRMQDTKETTGGVFWTLKRFFNKTLFTEDGVYLHGRLMAVNLVQFFVATVIVSLFVVVFDVLDEFVGNVDDGCDVVIGENGVEFPNYGDKWNTTADSGLTAEDGTGGVYNINSTHFTFDSYFVFNNITYFDQQIFEGQVPQFVDGEFDLGDVSTPMVCFNNQLGNFFLNASGVFPNPEADENAFIESLGLKEYEWKGALAFGLVMAFMAVLGIACAHVPSFTSSVLKLRSGLTPSLKAPREDFANLRRSPDYTSTIFGTCFWGCLYTAGFVFFLCALIFFVTVFSVTWPYVRTIIAGFTGMAVTIGIKTIIMKILRGTFYSSFYRKRPAASSIMGVILECWSLGLSIGVVTSRFIKLVGVTALYIGRIDVPMLAPGVGYVGPVNLDTAPVSFKVDLLSHEAHRHPLIERLGLLYLLKLYNGKDFGSRAGAYWRMLFVLALMPWMRNYRSHPDQRLLSNGEEDDDDDIISVRRQVINEMDNMDERSARSDYDIHGVQLELDLTRRAYDKINKRNKDLKDALLAARDKVRKMKSERRKDALLAARDKVRKMKSERRELKKELTEAGGRTSRISNISSTTDIDAVLAASTHTSLNS